MKNEFELKIKCIRAIKFDNISEVNVLIEVLQHYKHCKKFTLDIKNQVDLLLDTLYETQKMFMGK